MVGDWIRIGGICAAEVDLDGPFVRPSGQNGGLVFRGSIGKNIWWQEYWGEGARRRFSCRLLAVGARNLLAK